MTIRRIVIRKTPERKRGWLAQRLPSVIPRRVSCPQLHRPIRRIVIRKTPGRKRGDGLPNSSASSRPHPAANGSPRPPLQYRSPAPGPPACRHRSPLGKRQIDRPGPARGRRWPATASARLKPIIRLIARNKSHGPKWAEIFQPLCDPFRPPTRTRAFAYSSDMDSRRPPSQRAAAAIAEFLDLP